MNENTIVDPRQEIIPAWYELSYKNKNTLLIRIHRLAMEEILANDHEKSQAVIFYREKFKFGPFVPPTKPNWGFDGVLSLVKTADPDWITYKCVLPIWINKAQAKNQKENSWEIRSTLSILFTHLWLFEKNTGMKVPQLLVIDALLVQGGLHGGGLSAMVTPALCKWVASFPEHASLPEVQKAMYQTHAYLFPETKGFKWNISEFRVHCIKPNRLYMQIPGNACDLSPDVMLGYDEDREARGYTLVPHNVDSFLQQFTFLMGLAKVHDLVRRAQTKNP